MGNGQRGTLHRQIGRLFSEGMDAGASDTQLLKRFATTRDEDAFATLMTRHGPMVHSVCRGVLHESRDVDDAFQAVFLILARKADGIWAEGQLGGWLHKVAYRVSLRANAASSRRRIHERRFAELASLEPGADRNDDFGPTLHTEIDLLPPRFRLPVVLCYFDGLTQAQVASELKCGEATVRRRLAGARERLRTRLLQKGFAPSVALAALELSVVSEAKAAIPMACVEATLKAAMRISAGESVSAVAGARILELSRGGVGAMAIGVGKVTIGLILLGACVSLPMVLAGMEDDRPKVMEKPSPIGTSRGRVAEAPPAEDMLRFQGRVLDPEGKPVAGASIFVSHNFIEFRPNPVALRSRGISGKDGLFSLEIKKADLPTSLYIEAREMPLLVASAPGFAPGFRTQADADGRWSIRMVRDDTTVEGRIINVDGQPVVGASVRVISLSQHSSGSLDPFFAALDEGRPATVAQNELLEDWRSDDVAGSFSKVTTGSDGRFRLEGIGRDRLARVLIEGPTIESAIERVATRAMATRRAPDWGAFYSRVYIYHGAKFEVVAGPTRLVIGQIRDAETGRPLEGALLTSNRPSDCSYIHATTDSEGRYRLTGLHLRRDNIGERAEILVTPRPGQAYVRGSFWLDDSRDTKAVTHDLALRKGVRLRGRTIDMATGKPLRASIEYLTRDGNTHLRDYPTISDVRTGVPALVSDEDGRFELVGIPGPGVVTARLRSVTDVPYRMGVGAESIIKEKSNDPEIFVGGEGKWHIVNNFHVLAPIDPAPGLDELEVTLAFDAGSSLEATIVGPDDQPVAGAIVEGWIHFWDQPIGLLESSRVTIRGLAPGEERRISARHPALRLAGSKVIDGDAKGPIRIKLEPCGVVTGRVVVPDDQPQDKVAVTCKGANPSKIQIDAEGRFRAETIAPGVPFSVRIHSKKSTKVIKQIPEMTLARIIHPCHDSGRSGCPIDR